jgi:lipoprotein-releasing system permease protein
MAAELYLARRYLFNHRPGAWGWLIGWMATGSVALGVAALIVTLAVMTGFRQDIRDKILGVQPHVIVSAFNGRLDPADPALPRALDNQPDILAWSPYVSGQVLIGRGQQSSGAMVKGVDPKLEPKIANLNAKIVSGDWSALAATEGEGRPRIILGQELARNLGARLGDTVWLITPGSIGVSALSIPKAHLFIVSGIVQSGLYDYDSTLAYVAIPPAQKLFGMENAVSGIGVRVRDAEDSDRVSREVAMRFEGKYWVRSWLSLNRNLFSALKLEKTVMFIILTMVTLVASVMIVSNLLLSITQKVREIGILRAMGATGASVRHVFLLQGALMGVVGTLIGTSIGIALSVLLERTQLIKLPADVYYIDRLPVRIEAADVGMVVFAACFIVLAATLYPAHRATQVDPLEAIRYG